MIPTMILPMILTAAAAVPAPIADGRIDVLLHGRYVCELPGDATGPASRPVKGAWFDVVNNSSYLSEGGGGTYLRTGDKVVFTRGPMKGAMFSVTGDRAIQRTDLSGELRAMRCVRGGGVR